jgi:phage gpG-like protein
MPRSVFGPSDFNLGGNKTYRIDASFDAGNLLNLRAKPQQGSQIIRRVEQGIARANQRIIVDLKAALDDAIRTNAWSGLQGRADIYDSGELLQSGTVTLSGDGVTIAYSAPYASLVHYGGYIFPYGRSESRVYLPARPWIDSVLRGNGPTARFDFEAYYREAIEAAFR